MITKIKVFSSQPGAPELPLGGFMPNDDLVQIRGIEGLGPVKADIASTPFATGHGELYQGGSTPKRNIVLTLGLNPNWIDQTMMSLRQLLYQYFMPKTWSNFRFISDELPEVFINGVVESFEPNIFSEDPEVQISIICPKPDFIDVDPTVIHGTSVDPTDTGPPVLVDYIGTVPTGFEFHLLASSVVSTFLGEVNLTSSSGGLSQMFNLNDAVVTADMFLEVNTAKTTRHVYNVIFADNEEINVLGKMTKDSTWPEFTPGPNEFKVVTAEPGLNWNLGYFTRFGGL